MTPEPSCPFLALCLCSCCSPHLESPESESGGHLVMSNSLRPHGLDSPWNSPGQNTRLVNLSLLRGIFPTQASNSGLQHCWHILYQLSHKGSPRILEWVGYPFFSRSSQPRNRTRVSCIAGRFLPPLNKSFPSHP